VGFCKEMSAREANILELFERVRKAIEKKQDGVERIAVLASGAGKVFRKALRFLRYRRCL
jgi:precorrin-3B methylase